GLGTCRSRWWGAGCTSPCSVREPLGYSVPRLDSHWRRSVRRISRPTGRLERISRWSERQLLLVFYPVASLPLIGVGYGLYRYFTWGGAGQGSVAIALVGGLLVKTFAIPLIKGIVTGALFR